MKTIKKKAPAPAPEQKNKNEKTDENCMRRSPFPSPGAKKKRKFETKDINNEPVSQRNKKMHI